MSLNIIKVPRAETGMKRRRQREEEKEYSRHRENNLWRHRNEQTKNNGSSFMQEVWY